MPLTLNVGLSKKVGLPDYGSLGVSCNVQVGLDSTLLLNDADGFQHKVRQAYLACHQAAQDELQRQQQVGSSRASSGNSASSKKHPQNGDHTNGRPKEQLRQATASQVRAIEAIARRHDVDLATLLQARYGSQKTADLSITQASGLIDDLKAAPNDSGGAR